MGLQRTSRRWKIKERRGKRVYLEKELHIEGFYVPVRVFREDAIKGVALQSFSIYPVTPTLIRSFIEQVGDVEWDYSFQEKGGRLNFWVKDPYGNVFDNLKEVEKYVSRLVSRGLILAKALEPVNLSFIEEILAKEGWLVHKDENTLTARITTSTGKGGYVHEIEVRSINSRSLIRIEERVYTWKEKDDTIIKLLEGKFPNARISIRSQHPLTIVLTMECRNRDLPSIIKKMTDYIQEIR
ncbi:MAG: hypothetical protein DRJ47_00265 [Thermoprotei archaeon]|nr:MAG: hypothetical protein DRJ47_00265 [Thermoprotei archaeon]